MRRWLNACALVLAACGAPKPADAPPPVAPPPAVADNEPWLTTLDRDHPLVGDIWDAEQGAVIDASALARRLATAKFVLLGEQHDNPDHHRLQARLITELVKAGRRPAVVLEMLEIEQQPEIDRYVAQSDASAAGFGAALGWEKTSWPPFSEYQPIFEAAFATKLSIVAGNIAQEQARALVKQGLGALPAERAHQLRLDQPFPPALEAALIDELRASHCGQLPESLLGPMALAQHARDAQMAQALRSAGGVDGAVLIAGAGHARLDRGAAYYLKLEEPDAQVVSVLFHEVHREDKDASGTFTQQGPFDYVWFTPRASDDDPCAGFHERQSREGPCRVRNQTYARNQISPMISRPAARRFAF